MAAGFKQDVLLSCLFLGSGLLKLQRAPAVTCRESTELALHLSSDVTVTVLFAF